MYMIVVSDLTTCMRMNTSDDWSWRHLTLWVLMRSYKTDRNYQAFFISEVCHLIKNKNVRSSSSLFNVWLCDCTLSLFFCRLDRLELLHVSFVNWFAWNLHISSFWNSKETSIMRFQCLHYVDKPYKVKVIKYAKLWWSFTDKVIAVVGWPSSASSI